MLAVGAKIGILGGGQLGRMLALTAAELGFKTYIYSPEPAPCAAYVAAHHLRAAYDDQEALKTFAKEMDVLTFEFENIPYETAQFLAALKPFHPPPRALQVLQDRLTEKKFLNGLNIATALFATPEDYRGQFSPPVIIKTRRLGYDGKGQITASSEAEIKKVGAQFEAPVIIEQKIFFSREIAIITARDLQGRMIFYDPVETHHQQGILREARVPVRLDGDLSRQAIANTRKIAEALDYVGVLAVEMFEVDGQLLVNEIAPRVHNSGHWTQDACLTSQFAQHIRAIAGWPLGAPTRLADVVMTNLLGEEVLHAAQKADPATSAVHIYDKGEARKDRKMGHITQLLPISAGAKIR